MPPILGVCAGHDPHRLCALVRVSTRLTHTDPKAEHGALAVALATFQSSQGATSPAVFLGVLRAALAEKGAAADELVALIERAAASAARGETTERFAERLGLASGVSGYIYHTVPVALHAWLRHAGDLEAAVGGVIACGGDTDTTAAITGGIVGAGVGAAGIPPAWLSGLAEWPRGTGWLANLGERLVNTMAGGEARSPLPFFWPALLLRNALFLGVVLYHGLRRLLPPF